MSKYNALWEYVQRNGKGTHGFRFIGLSHKIKNRDYWRKMENEVND